MKEISYIELKFLKDNHKYQEAIDYILDSGIFDEAYSYSLNKELLNTLYSFMIDEYINTAKREEKLGQLISLFLKVNKYSNDLTRGYTLFLENLKNFVVKRIRATKSVDVISIRQTYPYYSYYLKILEELSLVSDDTLKDVLLVNSTMDFDIALYDRLEVFFSRTNHQLKAYDIMNKSCLLILDLMEMVTYLISKSEIEDYEKVNLMDLYDNFLYTMVKEYVDQEKLSKLELDEYCTAINECFNKSLEVFDKYLESFDSSLNRSVLPRFIPYGIKYNLTSNSNNKLLYLELYLKDYLSEFFLLVEEKAFSTELVKLYDFIIKKVLEEVSLDEFMKANAFHYLNEMFIIYPYRKFSNTKKMMETLNELKRNNIKPNSSVLSTRVREINFNNNLIMIYLSLLQSVFTKYNLRINFSKLSNLGIRYSDTYQEYQRNYPKNELK